jgi:hypothetical protein
MPSKRRKHSKRKQTRKSTSKYFGVWGDGCPMGSSILTDFNSDRNKTEPCYENCNFFSEQESWKHCTSSDGKRRERKVVNR